MASKSRLPFEDTEVPESRSRAHIVELLEELKFDVGQISLSSGQKVIMAQHGHARFEFTIDEQKVIDAILAAYSDAHKREMQYNGQTKRKALARAQERASRMAWRMVYLQVKALTDAIKLGTAEISQAFGGYLVFQQPDGTRRSLAELVIKEAEEGRISSGQPMAMLLALPMKQPST